MNLRIRSIFMVFRRGDDIVSIIASRIARVVSAGDFLFCVTN